MVYEDDQFCAFLDIFGGVEGHTLVVPKKHYQWTYDVPNFGEYWEVARKVALVVQKAEEAPWIQFFTFGAIPHAHIHIYPRKESSPLGVEAVLPKQERAKDELERTAEKIRASF